MNCLFETSVHKGEKASILDLQQKSFDHIFINLDRNKDWYYILEYP